MRPWGWRRWSGYDARIDAQKDGGASDSHNGGEEKAGF